MVIKIMLMDVAFLLGNEFSTTHELLITKQMLFFFLVLNSLSSMLDKVGHIQIGKIKIKYI